MTYQQRDGTIVIDVTGRKAVERAIDVVLEVRLDSILLAQACTEEILRSIADAGYVCVPRQPSATMLDSAWANALGEDALGVWSDMIQAAEMERLRDQQGEL